MHVGMRSQVGNYLFYGPYGSSLGFSRARGTVLALRLEELCLPAAGA